MNIYYVYAYLRHKDSQTAKAGTPYYVGKGQGDRIKTGHTCAIPKDKSKIVMLEQNLSEIGALALERRMITWYGRVDQKTGILRNLTDGGEGGHRRRVTDSERVKARAAKIGIPKSEKHKASMSGPKTEVHRANITKANRLRCLGKPAHNKGISGPMLGVPKTE